MNIDEYISYDGLGLAELVREKKVKSSELVELAIKQIETYNPKINAVIYTFFEKALETSKNISLEGAFCGVPFLIKDLGVELAGEPIYKGNKFRYDQVVNNKRFFPVQDSELVARYKKAGLIILGKTNTPEWGLTTVTEPRVFGTCNNPWNLERTSGGSSGGSGAAVGARIVPLAHGNDGGGSIRIPASCCGLFGLKPSRGRTPIGPVHSEAWQGLAIDHILSLSVRDSAAMLDETSGIDAGAPYDSPHAATPFLKSVDESPGKLTIAATADPFLPATTHADCIAAFEETVEFLRGLGHTVIEKSPEIDGKAFSSAFVIMTSGAVAADIAEEEEFFEKKATFSDFEPTTWMLGLLGKQFSAFELEKAIRHLKDTHRSIARFFEDESIDLMLTPTLAMPPLKHGELQPKGIEAFLLNILGRLNAGRALKTAVDSLAEQIFAFFPWTPVFNATGQPAMSVPLQWNKDGLPIGMHFIGKYGDEATLFKLAGQLEKEKPWADKLPPLLQAS
jgi:amidase